MASVEYINTGKEGQVMLYHSNQYPYGAIGPVSFMWRQYTSDHKDNQLSQLWIWVHPSCYEEAMQEIQNVCSYSSNKSSNSTSTNANTSTSSDSSSSCKEESRQGCSNLTVTSLRFDLVRLHLIGPLALPLLAEMLEIDQRKSDGEKDSKDDILVCGSEACESNNNSKDSGHHKKEQVCF